jgi:hypothetical protein
MKAGETAVLVSLAVFAAGGVFVAFTDSPSLEIMEEMIPHEEPPSIYEMLQKEINPYHFGNVPRVSFSADTTVWTVDLDHNMYTVPQAVFFVTGTLREMGFTAITAAERGSGGVVFRALFPNGHPIRITFTSP